MSSNQPALEAGLLANDQLNPDDTPTTKSGKTLMDLKWEVFAMCLAILIQGYLMLSCFSYTGFLVIKLVPGLNVNNAGTYAGLLNAMFMIARSFSSYAWGELADKYGRKQVFYGSYILSCFFSVGFGFSTTLWMAFLFRFFLGASNGLVAVVKVVVTEYSEGDKELEGKMMGFVFGMRGWAYFLSPSIGGYLSDPVKQYPNSLLATKFTGFFTKYPYILPNIFGVILCLCGCLSIYYAIKETKPTHIVETNPTHVVETNEPPAEVTFKTIWAKKATRDHLIAYWFLLLCLLCIDGAIPLFLIATDGGLSLQEKGIGDVLFASGAVYGIFQYFIYSKVWNRFGLYGTLQLSSILGTPAVIFIPISALLNRGEPPSELSIIALLYLATIIGFNLVFMIAYYSAITVAANRTVSSEELSIMNGVSMVGGSVAQGLGPILAGFLTAYALTSGVFSPNVGVYVTFGTVSAIGIGLVFFTRFTLRKHHMD